MKQLTLAISALAVWSLSATSLPAQNVSGYDRFSNPYLLLLREAAVLDDLKLSGDQRAVLLKLNAEVDGPLLSMRNKPAAESAKTFKELLSKTQSQMDDLLTQEQRTRITQIKLRVRGIKAVLNEEVVERLQLTDKQQETIKEIIAATSKEIAELTKQQADGTPYATIAKKMRAVREQEQRDVLKALSTVQKRRLTQLFGRSFDLSKLGHVAFKAPDFVESGGWINTGPMRLSQFRGKVLAVHFWAFG